jgi:broad specificity phosphatase PhoE
MHHLESLEGPIAAVQRLIERLNNQGVIIGGVAASVLGRPRLTADADADVDISLGLLPFEVETVERSQEIDVGSLRIRLPAHARRPDHSQSDRSPSEGFGRHRSGNKYAKISGL